jgi:hypothetical protein
VNSTVLPTSVADLVPAHRLDEFIAATPPRLFGIGPVSIALHASDARLAALLGAALAHAACDTPRPCHLRVAAIDTGAIGWPRPPGVPGTEHLRPPMDEVNLRAGRLIQAIHQAGSCTWESYDADTRTGLLLTADAALVAPWEWASPLKRHIAWATREEPFGLLHGAVIGDAAGGVMLAGGSGVGKSTTAAAALQAGLSSAGDDLTLLSLDADSGVVAHAAFDAVKLSDATLRLIGAAPPPGGVASGAGIAKHILPLSTLGAGRLAPRVPLRAILLPRLAGSPRSAIRPAVMAAALRALGPVSGFVMRVTPESSFALAARMVRDLPCFALDIGEDPAEAARCIAAFLEARRP